MGSIAHLIDAAVRKLEVRLDVLDAKISAIQTHVTSQTSTGQCVYITVNIQRTIEALKIFGDYVTAGQVAAVTGRVRAVESSYLNELYREGAVDKKRDRRNTLFLLKEKFRKSNSKV
jgi:energy-converting hydrogenase Eha subunit A